MSIPGESWRNFTSRFSSSISFRCPAAILGIAAVSLFFLGPQMGSLDTDGDGCPDTPVVILSSIPVAQPFSFVSNSQPSRIRAARVLANVIRAYYDESDDAGSPAGRAALKSFCLLRC